MATLQTVQTVSPTSIGVVHNAAISDMLRCMCPTCTCNCCCWPKIKARTYVQVHENRIESNYPCLPLCGCGFCCMTDCVRVQYFDKIGSSIKPANICTPFHLCFLIPCCGQVVAMTPMECCNNDCCRCLCPPCIHCSHYLPGLVNANEVGDYATKARDAFRRGERMLAAPPRQHMGETQMT
jgi:hypothetical protein